MAAAGFELSWCKTGAATRGFTMWLGLLVILRLGSKRAYPKSEHTKRQDTEAAKPSLKHIRHHHGHFCWFLLTQVVMGPANLQALETPSLPLDGEWQGHAV